MRVVKPLRPSEPEGTEGRRSLSTRCFHVSASSRPLETEGFSLSLSYALSQTHDLSMGYWAATAMDYG